MSMKRITYRKEPVWGRKGKGREGKSLMVYIGRGLRGDDNPRSAAAENAKGKGKKREEKEKRSCVL